jgi:hypothetical protein
MRFEKATESALLQMEGKLQETDRRPEGEDQSKAAVL